MVRKLKALNNPVTVMANQIAGLIGGGTANSPIIDSAKSRDTALIIAALPFVSLSLIHPSTGSCTTSNRRRPNRIAPSAVRLTP